MSRLNGYDFLRAGAGMAPALLLLNPQQDGRWNRTLRVKGGDAVFSIAAALFY